MNVLPSHAEILSTSRGLKSPNPETEGSVGGQTNSEAPNPKLYSPKSIFTSYRPKTLNPKALRGLLKDAQGTLDLHELSPGAAAAAVSDYPEDGVPNLGSGFSFAWVQVAQIFFMVKLAKPWVSGMFG